MVRTPWTSAPTSQRFSTPTVSRLPGLLPRPYHRHFMLDLKTTTRAVPRFTFSPTRAAPSVRLVFVVGRARMFYLPFTFCPPLCTVGTPNTIVLWGVFSATSKVRITFVDSTALVLTSASTSPGLTVPSPTNCITAPRAGPSLAPASYSPPTAPFSSPSPSAPRLLPSALPKVKPPLYLFVFVTSFLFVTLSLCCVVSLSLVLLLSFSTTTLLSFTRFVVAWSLVACVMSVSLSVSSFTLLSSAISASVSVLLLSNSPLSLPTLFPALLAIPFSRSP